jgi:acetoin:2,6-dichlorophenolindophenol oxidoreductase subunit alpha
MVELAPSPAAPPAVPPLKTESKQESYVRAYRWMLLARTLDEKLAALYKAGGKISGGVFLGTGQEALSTSLGLALRKGDVFAPLIRDLAGRLAFGESVLDATRTYLGSRLGPMRGRDGNIHRGRIHEGQMAMISHLGAMISTTAGVLLARRMRGETGTVGAISIGDGATSTGSTHEGLNIAAVERLPMVAVVANNQYAYSTPTSRQFACEDLIDRAKGYGYEGHSVDGTDLEACLEVLQTAVSRAREGKGPQMVVARLLRLTGHGLHDDASYVDAKLKASPVGADCLKLADKTLVERNWATAKDLAAWKEQCVKEVDEAAAQAMRDPAPDPSLEDWSALNEPEMLDLGLATRG